MDVNPNRAIDFDNTEIAFSHKNDQQLRKMSWLFKLMNNSTLVNFGSSFGLKAIKWGLPFAKTAVKHTVFEHFCGGETLDECQDDINLLEKYGVETVLDYGAEAKTTDEDLDAVKAQINTAIEFASSNTSVPVVVSKLTGLVDSQILINLQANGSLNDSEQVAFDKLMVRMHELCVNAHKLGVALFIDAEESWLQNSIDAIADQLMASYNKEKVVVYNTYQMYRHDRLDFLKKSYQLAVDNGYLLGAKIVRGAYMEKERSRAERLKIASPIQINKADTDRDYNDALRFCIQHYERLSICCGTHNVESTQLFADLIDQNKIKRNHPHLNFSQLFGMSDFITLNLSSAGFNVSKYLPYGPIEDVIPYLIRRAQENSSMSGEMGRELSMVQREVDRRGI